MHVCIYWSLFRIFRFMNEYNPFIYRLLHNFLHDSDRNEDLVYLVTPFKVILNEGDSSSLPELLWRAPVDSSQCWLKKCHL